MAKGGRTADAMNKDPLIATKWKGRVLIGIEFEETEAPKLGVEAMSTEPPKDVEGKVMEGEKSIVDLSLEAMSLTKYLVMYEFSQVLNIPQKEGEFNLQISIAEKEFHTPTDVRIVGYNYNRWNRLRTEEPIELDLPYKEIKDMDDIFLYLCPDKGGFGSRLPFGKKADKGVGNPIAYSKLRAEEFADPNPSLKWIEMDIEPVEDVIKSPELAGVVAFRLSIVRIDPAKDLAEQKKVLKE